MLVSTSFKCLISRPQSWLLCVLMLSCQTFRGLNLRKDLYFLRYQVRSQSKQIAQFINRRVFRRPQTGLSLTSLDTRTVIWTGPPSTAEASDLCPIKTARDGRSRLCPRDGACRRPGTALSTTRAGQVRDRSKGVLTERQMLLELEHPGIATASTTEPTA